MSTGVVEIASMTACMLTSVVPEDPGSGLYELHERARCMGIHDLLLSMRHAN